MTEVKTRQIIKLECASIRSPDIAAEDVAERALKQRQIAKLRSSAVDNKNKTSTFT